MKERTQDELCEELNKLEFGVKFLDGRHSNRKLDKCKSGVNCKKNLSPSDSEQSVFIGMKTEDGFTKGREYNVCSIWENVDIGEDGYGFKSDDGLVRVFWEEEMKGMFCVRKWKVANITKAGKILKKKIIEDTTKPSKVEDIIHLDTEMIIKKRIYKKLNKALSDTRSYLEKSLQTNSKLKKTIINQQIFISRHKKVKKLAFRWNAVVNIVLLGLLFVSIFGGC